MATSNAQRIGIWVIAVAMLLGTLISFVVIIFANDNARTDQARVQQIEEEYTEAVNEYQRKAALQAEELSGRYYATLAKYRNNPTAFDPDTVTELEVSDLEAGDGEELTQESTFTAYYIGWNQDGAIFDSSFDGDSLKNPLTVAPGDVISGWTEGVAGMKVGGVRQLDIPAEKAYADRGRGELIAPGAPIKFIIFVIPAPEDLEYPPIPQELINYYTRGVL